MLNPDYKTGLPYKRGRRAALSRKPRESCPYNGNELREEWFAGYDDIAATLSPTEAQRKITIEGQHLRWLITGLLIEHFQSTRASTEGESFDYIVSDTCNRVHKYLTSHGSKGTDGTASDMQCRACTEAALAFLPKGLTTLYDPNAEIIVSW
jgi:ribosome modulation factor